MTIPTLSDRSIFHINIMDPFPNVLPIEYQSDISFLSVQIKRIRDTFDDLHLFFDFENAPDLIQYEQRVRQFRSQDRQQPRNGLPNQHSSLLPPAPPRLPRQSTLTPKFPQILILLKQLTEYFQQIQSTLQRKEEDFNRFIITPLSRPIFSDVFATRQTQQHLEQLYSLHAQYISLPLGLPPKFELETQAFLLHTTDSVTTQQLISSNSSFGHISPSIISDNVNSFHDNNGNPIEQTFQQQLKLLQNVQTLGDIVISDPDVVHALQSQDVTEVITDLISFNKKIAQIFSNLLLTSKSRPSSSSSLVQIDNQYATEVLSSVDFSPPAPIIEQPTTSNDPQFSHQQHSQLHFAPTSGQLAFSAFQLQLNMMKTGELLRGD